MTMTFFFTRKHDMSGSGGVVKKTRPRVRFANQEGHALVKVHMVPGEGRGYDPGYQDRLDRIQGLKMHGIPVQRKMLDDDFGHETSRGRFKIKTDGTRGTYTSDMARQDIAHARTHGVPWYRVVRSSRFGPVTFASRSSPTTRVALSAARRILAE